MSGSVYAFGAFDVLSAFEDRPAVLAFEAFFAVETEDVKFGPFGAAAEADVFFALLAWCVLGFYCGGKFRDFVFDRVDDGV